MIILFFSGTKLEPRCFALRRPGSEGGEIEIEKEFKNASTVSLTEEEYENLIYVTNMDGFLAVAPTAKIEMTNEAGDVTLFEFQEDQKRDSGGRGLGKLSTVADQKGWEKLSLLSIVRNAV